MLTRTRAIVCLTLCMALGPHPASPQSRSTAIPTLEPGVLSSGEVYRGTSTPDGRTLYFFKETGAGETYRIFSTHRTATGWTAPVVVDLGGTYSDLYPALSPDGRRMVFSSYRPAPGDTTAKPGAHLWSVERTATGWSAPTFLERASTFGHYHSWVEFGFDGALYFRRTTPDWRSTETLRAATFPPLRLADALASPHTSSEIRYVANSGMLVSMAGRRFLIDAPIREGLAPYAVSTASERARLEAARAPYDRIDAILITHWHEDHFNADAIAAHLRNSPATVVISSPEVLDRVRRSAPDLPASRLRASLPEPGSSERIDGFGVPVHVLRLRHNPTRRLPEQHVGFLIGSDTPVLHVGDADPAIDNFALLRSLPRVDVALLPFWYVTADANRLVVTNAVRPRRIVAMHAPPRDVERIATEIRAAGVTADIASAPGTPLRLAR